MPPRIALTPLYTACELDVMHGFLLSEAGCGKRLTVSPHKQLFHAVHKPTCHSRAMQVHLRRCRAARIRQHQRALQTHPSVREPKQRESFLTRPFLPAALRAIWNVHKTVTVFCHLFSFFSHWSRAMQKITFLGHAALCNKKRKTASDNGFPAIALPTNLASCAYLLHGRGRA